MDALKENIKFLKGVGEYRAKKLNKLHIWTIGDLIEFFPRDYINRKKAVSINNLKFNEINSLVAKVVSLEERRLRNNKKQLNVVISDGKDHLFLTWFRYGKWITEQFESGKTIWVSGNVTEFRNIPQIIHPEFEILDEEEKTSFWHSRQVLPVYHLTKGITINLMRQLIYNAFQLYAKNIKETLPDYILEKYHFPDRNIALQKIHFTQNPTEVKKLKLRFIFEELFFTQLMLARVKKKHHKEIGNRFQLKKTFTTHLKKNLPFELTKAQKKVIREIVEDMTSKHQMNRLLQGDVGAGKTIVTVFAMLLALENGFQAVLMAPTEILAEQHYYGIKKLLEDQNQIKIAILKGGAYKGKKTILEDIKNGEIDIVIGTHALIQKNVHFQKVGFVAIDEQHRFGVEQRAVLSQKNKNPDLLYLTATPIPRSLALTVYGDLDVSLLDELPSGRKQIKTIRHNANKRNVVYQKVKIDLRQGRQIYVVCPLIEESEKVDLLDAETLYHRLAEKVFPDFNVEILHGRMKTIEKEKIMQDFVDGKIDILVSTTVIEVGIDVPNATVMIIEHAERFGLSQLHQLRGRVGRGSARSFCYLIVHPPISEEGRKRLNMIVETNDGFQIAEKDLEIRGPGDFFGTDQSGIPYFRHANILRDKAILDQARIQAFKIIKEDPELELPENDKLRNIYFSKFAEREKLFDF